MSALAYWFPFAVAAVLVGTALVNLVRYPPT